MERILASFQIITKLTPIPGADRIETARILGWDVVVRKSEFVVGEMCVYFEIDSVLPLKPWSEFLYNENEPDAPIRLRTVRLRKQISQGLAVPPRFINKLSDVDKVVGADLSEILGVKKYIPVIPACLECDVIGGFPSFIIKTDEERIQNLPNFVTEFAGKPFYIAEKLDGSSCTIYRRDGVFGVCSHNWDLCENDKNAFWRIAKELDIEAKIIDKYGDRNIAVQGELVGPSIQKNRLKLDKLKLFVFSVFDIDKFCKVPYDEFVETCIELKLETVPILTSSWALTGSMDDLVSMGNGASALANVPREGIVCRCRNNSHISFKVLSNDYLLKNRE